MIPVAWTHRATAALLSYVADEEVFLRGIPEDSRACVVLHAPAADSAAVAAHLTELARERRQLHRKWYFGSWAALSVTIPLMIIPIVPAVPFYWCAPRLVALVAHACSIRLAARAYATGTAFAVHRNCFRIWGHRKAWLGSARLEVLLVKPVLAAPLKPCTRTLACAGGECCRVAAAVDAAGDGRSVVVACDLLAVPHSAAAAADEASFARAAAAVERALDAPGLAEHAQERLLAALKLRKQHGQV